MVRNGCVTNCVLRLALVCSWIGLVGLELPSCAGSQHAVVDVASGEVEDSTGDQSLTSDSHGGTESKGDTGEYAADGEWTVVSRPYPSVGPRPGVVSSGQKVFVAWTSTVDCSAEDAEAEACESWTGPGEVEMVEWRGFAPIPGDEGAGNTAALAFPDGDCEICGFWLAGSYLAVGDSGGMVVWGLNPAEFEGPNNHIGVWYGAPVKTEDATKLQLGEFDAPASPPAALIWLQSGSYLFMWWEQSSSDGTCLHWVRFDGEHVDESGTEQIPGTAVAQTSAVRLSATEVAVAFVQSCEPEEDLCTLLKFGRMSTTDMAFDVVGTIPPTVGPISLIDIVSIGTERIAIAYLEGEKEQIDLNVSVLDASNGDLLFTAPIATEDVMWNYSPRLAALPGGAMVVAWISRDEDAAGVLARLVTAGGEPGVVFRVNQETPGVQSDAWPVALPDGRVLFAWLSQSGEGLRSGATDIMARIISVPQE